MERKGFEMQNVSVARLVEDMDIYPRVQVDDYHVSTIAEAVRAGNQMPPLVVGQLKGHRTKTFLIIDGVHRSRAYRKVFGNNVSVPVTAKFYLSKAEMIFEAAQLNASHGRTLAMQDKTKCIVMLEKSGYSVDDISRALALTVERVKTLRAERVASHNDAMVALKLTTRHLAGRDLSDDEMDYQSKAGGRPQSFYVNQVISMLEHETVDWTDTRLVDQLVELSRLLEEQKGRLALKVK